MCHPRDRRKGDCKSIKVLAAWVAIRGGMETRYVATIIALMLGPVIVGAFALWCTLEWWS